MRGEVMAEITFENMAERLIEEFPELTEKYRSVVDWWGEEVPGPHIIFGDVLNPYIITLIDSGRDDEKLKDIFKFLESLASHDDKRVQEVVMMTVCERLEYDKKLLTKARKYMGPTTRRFSEEIERFWKKK
jgi:hypothetical protein